MWTFNNDTIRAEDGGWCYYYFVKGEPGNELSNEWRYVSFEVGPGTARPIPKNAKFLSVMAVVNYTDSTATYQMCGFRVIELI